MKNIDIKVFSMKIENFLRMMLFTVFMMVLPIQIQAMTPFTCDDTFYFSNIQDSKAVFQKVNRDVLPYENVTLGTPSETKYNAIGYNIQDNFIYAVVMNKLVKIDKNGDVLTLDEITGGYPNNKQMYSGEFDRNGIYYVYDTETH